MTFKVIQGHWQWCHSIGHIRFPISDTKEREGYTDCVELLIEASAEIETRDNCGQTPLYLAACKGHIKVVQFLIEHHADVNACHIGGASCLVRAACYGHTDVCPLSAVCIRQWYFTSEKFISIIIQFWTD